MWSSSRRRPLAVAIGCILGGAVAGAASAAEYYAQPLFEAGAKYHTNRGLNLDEAGTEDVAGIELDGALLLGVVGPTGETIVRPRVRYQKFEQSENLDNTDYGLDLRTEYTSPRHNFQLSAGAFRRDTLSTEFIEPGFDELNPDDPTVTDPGQIAVDNTMDRYHVRPSYDFRFGPRTRAGVNATAQAVRFGVQGQDSRVDYNYGNAGLSWDFQATERTTLLLDPYVSYYETLNDRYTSDGTGISLGFDHEWSETSHLTMTVGAERSHTETIPVVNTPTGPIEQPLVEEDTTDYSGEISFTRVGELNKFRLSMGHDIWPSTRGTKVSADHFNAQWTHLVSERCDIVTSARYVLEQGIGELDTQGDRMHASAELGMRWRMTERWYIQGTVEYLVQDFETDPQTANDFNVFLGFGYKGLGSQAGSTE